MSLAIGINKKDLRDIYRLLDAKEGYTFQLLEHKLWIYHPDAAKLEAMQRQLAKENYTAQIQTIQPYWNMLSQPHVDAMLQLQVQAKDVFVDVMTKTHFSKNQLIPHAFDLLIMSALVQFEQIQRGYFSYRSHVTAYLNIQQQYSEPFRQFYDKYHEQFKQRLLTMIDFHEHSLALFEEIPWVSHLNRLKKTMIHEDTQSMDLDSLDYGDLDSSELHQAMLKNSAFIDYMKSQSFKEFQLSQTAVYQFIHALGIGTRTKYLLCYVIANLVEDCFQIDPFKLVNQFYLDSQNRPRIKQ